MDEVATAATTAEEAFVLATEGNLTTVNARHATDTDATVEAPTGMAAAVTTMATTTRDAEATSHTTTT